MSLQQWLDNAWIRKTDRSAQHVRDLRDIAVRQIGDASLAGISADGRFNHAYDAIRVMCEIALHAEGFTIPKGGRQHERAIESLKFTLGGDWSADVDFFDRCRRMRHESVYDRSNVVRPRDADELLGRAKELHRALDEWLASRHPDLVTNK